MIIKVMCRFPSGNLLFATSNIQDSLGNWQNKILSISELSRNIGEDKSYEISGMSIELDDTDRFFRDMMSGEFRYISGKTVEILTEDNTLIYAGTVEKWQYKEDTFSLSINDKLSGLETLIPKTITKERYPNLTAKANGQPIPLIYGRLEADTGAVKCWRVDTGLFLLADHHCHSLLGDVFNENGTIITGATLDNAADECAYILCTSPLESIYANVKGKMDDSLQLIENPIDALKDIITYYTPMNYNSAGMEAAREIVIERGYKIACVIDNEKNLQDVLKDFSFSFDCDFYVSKGNEVMVTLLNWSQLTPVKSYNESQIAEFDMEELPEQIRNRVKYQYQYNFALGQYLQMPEYTLQESVTGWGEFYNRNESLDLLYVADDVSAFDVVQRYVIQRKNPRRIAQLSLPLAEFIGVDISDIIEIQHAGAIDPNKRKYQVRRVNLDFVTDSVQVEAVDITTLAGGVFLLGDRTTLPLYWQLAGDSDRNFGYLADKETGYFAGGKDYGKVLY